MGTGRAGQCSLLPGTRGPAQPAEPATSDRGLRVSQLGRLQTRDNDNQCSTVQSLGDGIISITARAMLRISRV